MKVSASTPPEAPRGRRLGIVPGAIALVYLAAHLPFLAPSLEDIDSINFGLGLHDFDPSRHQPHPPGYPVYIALGRLSLALVSSLWQSLDRIAADALALSIWSAVGGAAALLAAAYVFAAFAAAGKRETPNPEPRIPDPGSRIPDLATALLASAPLFWMTGLRPMSDMPGLAAILAAQALLLSADSHRRRLVQGAVIAGLAIGIRSQAAWLTLPLLALMLVRQRRAGIWWLLSRPVTAFIAACLAWAIPLLIATGGIDGYIRALGSQAGEDFAWVDMLWANPTPRRLALSLYETLILPWASVPLAVAVLLAAVIGALVMLVRERRGLYTMAIVFAPYFAFHLLFQETVTVRYALPLVPPVAFLAVRGIGLLGRRMSVIAVPLVVAALIVAVPAGRAYGSEAHPAFRAIADMLRRADAQMPAGVYAHFGLWRPLQAAQLGRLHLVEPRRQYEWMSLVDYWRSGGTAPVWFLADPKRSDMALIDPSSRGDVIRYRWSVGERPELAGTRPAGVDWYRFQPPGWFAGEGWSLTPETGGLTQATATGPDHRPVEAWVRRRSGPLHMVVGGRHLGDPADPTAEFDLAIDDQIVDRWSLTAADRNFLRFVVLPDGTPPGTGSYARLTIASRPAGGDRRPAPVAVRQFDIQPTERLIYGFGEGWHEEEEPTPANGVRWRWTSERSVLRVKAPPRAVRLTLRGESPLRYFDTPPTVTVTAAGQVVGQFRPSADFEWSVTIPADAIARAEGAIAIETDHVYLPGKVEGTADERHLGLRIFECRVQSVSYSN